MGDRAAFPCACSVCHPSCCLHKMTGCLSYVCVYHYTCTYDGLHIPREQDRNADGTHTCTRSGRPTSPSRDSGAVVREAPCHHTDVCAVQAGGSVMCLLYIHTYTPSTVAVHVSATCYTCGHRRTQQPSVASLTTITQHIIKPDRIFHRRISSSAMRPTSSGRINTGSPTTSSNTTAPHSVGLRHRM